MMKNLIKQFSLAFLSLVIASLSISPALSYGGSSSGGGGSIGKCGGTNSPSFTEISPARNSTIDSLGDFSFTVNGRYLDEDQITISVGGKVLNAKFTTLEDGSIQVVADASSLSGLSGTIKVQISSTTTIGCSRTYAYFIELKTEEGGSTGDSGDDSGSGSGDDSGSGDGNGSGSGDGSGSGSGGHWAEEFLSDLVERGILKGDKDTGDLRQDDYLNRAEMVTLIARALGIEVPLSLDENPFLDVDKNEWYAGYVYQAKKLEWISGYEDGNFHPERNITRAEVLKILLVALGVSVSGTDSGFPDVPYYAWYAPYVTWAVNNGIISGYNDGNFKPHNFITRAEMSKVMSLTLKYLGM